ncbi:MAG: methylated-DNA--[protein]-cysteine S-methyltransferase, partial [Gammaproteobacteria bacterium]|nr:methylated-DNA--[protein]-cysteine S-methyltransferase [Gammaproteobacteria bacterium]
MNEAAKHGGSQASGVRRIDWPRILKEACRRIERDAPDLETLATTLRVGRAELQRQFTRRLGVSPKRYAQALALHRLARISNKGRHALDAVLEARFASTSAAYEQAARAFGAAPGRLRRPLKLGWWSGMSDLGWMLLGASERGVCWLTFGHDPQAMLADLRAAFPRAILYNDEARLYAWFERVREYVLLPEEAVDLPVDVRGTAFQSRVWRALRKIPLGETRSYGQVARTLGRPTAARAVASACASNRVALLIPCHRVVDAGGHPHGYRWGIERKRALLERERRTDLPAS